ncbi:hypothetical protein PR003_g20683 [Phytophthora rubi]|uniref:CCHC-type domain-containing protein n=1 Tax=Phytophthora rubi TaxID=129364 RepID=A0A6A3NK30_9STRA|nr:hypothetical protein PR001_g19544 [Phytophthora rubi]KAE9044810.1 hypothetical protein PR002_g2591 [Phytophthora rubi]KAE9308706.1 hypothetical protein PR003_g20683 [Phytophthora rubi]
MAFESSDDENSHDQAGDSSSGPGSASTAEIPTGTSSDSISRIPQPIFAVVAPPMVKSASREALVEWLKLRDEYVEATKERCKAGKEGLNAVLKSVKSSFDSDLLTTLCEATWGVSKSDLTDEFLLEQIHAITDSYQNQVLPPVNELFRKELKMNMTNCDIQSRVTDYFMSCNKLIKKYGLSSFFEGDKGTKKKCKLLVNSLPAMLKEKVQNEIEYRFPDAQTSVLKLSKLISQQALEQAIEDRALSRTRPTAKQGKARAAVQNQFQSKKRAAPQQHKSDKRFKKTASRKVEVKNGDEELPSKKGAPKTGCFNCGGSHYLSDCPTATKEDRERLTAKTCKKGGGPQRKNNPNL